MPDAAYNNRPSNDIAQRIAAFKADGDVDVLIIGAGINGAGLFRDLAAQGVKCLLVEQNDYGSGTSAAPSRLIHGGLKYLETGEFRLVAQSTLERNLLLVNAPHYVKPLPTTVPIFSWGRGLMSALRVFLGGKSTSRSRGAILIKIGLMFYDFYGKRQRVMPRHYMAGRTASLRNFPALTRDLVATATYYDAAISHPERLILELIQDALQDNPQALALNHASLSYVPSQSDLSAELTIRSSAHASAFTVRPKIVINAAGPWIDQVNALLGTPSQMIGGTKGSHIVLDHAPLAQALQGHMLYFEADDGRICLVYGYLDRVLVGATDIKADNPDQVRCEDSEIDYLLDSLGKLLPNLHFSRQQIVYSYSGIRPLPVSDAKEPGLISRDHASPLLEADDQRPFPIYSLVGGKWTTFRGFAEEVADMVLQRLNRPRKLSTRHLAIGGGRDYPCNQTERGAWIARIAQENGLTQERICQLFERYGTVAQVIAAHITTTDKPLIGASDYSEDEIDYLLRHEQVGSLADLVLRRTTLAVSGHLTARLVEALSHQAADILGWNDAQRSDEVANLKDRLKKFHGVTL